MGIDKFIQIENVGRFEKLVPKGDVSFKSFTLIYGENGHGKTTLAGVLRSLATGDAAYVTERQTLGQDGAPQVQVRMSAGTVAKFCKESWSVSGLEIEIFDSTFVRENVYAGDTVGGEHRQNLYEITVGKAGVELRNQVNNLDSEIKALGKKLKDVEERVGAKIQTPFSLEDFLGLLPEQEAEDRIREVTARLNASRNAKSVVDRPGLRPLQVPASPDGIVELLDISVERIAAQAMEAVRSHLHVTLGEGGERWVRDGQKYRTGEACPFCGQSEKGSPRFCRKLDKRAMQFQLRRVSARRPGR